MPILRVSMWKGRTHEQKSELAKALTEVMARVAKTSPEATTIIFDEIDKENWASGGTLVSDRL
ncbi:MAG: 2-hydroxymuconate tautomerase family protein [Chloroflexi bacterium]|nr:2-hydroxymuconate tautomerase family protein [Chloroflexota bacterium]